MKVLLTRKAHGHDHAKVMRIPLIHEPAGVILVVDLQKDRVAGHGLERLQEIPGIEAHFHG